MAFTSTPPLKRAVAFECGGLNSNHDRSGRLDSLKHNVDPRDDEAEATLEVQTGTGITRPRRPVTSSRRCSITSRPSSREIQSHVRAKYVPPSVGTVRKLRRRKHDTGGPTGARSPWSGLTGHRPRGGGTWIGT